MPSASVVYPCEEWLDARRDPGGRAADEERRWPAFWIVFWRVISLSESSRSSKAGRVARTGEMGGGEVRIGAW